MATLHAPVYDVLPTWFKARTALGLSIPIMTLSSLAGYHATGQNWFFLIPLIAYYGLTPILDWILGRDLKNPSAEVKEQLEAQPYYRQLLYFAAALYVGSITATLGTLGFGIGTIPWYWMLILTLSFAISNGAMILVAHELGHGHGPLDRRIARWLLMILGYGHFTLEHNVGHHVRVCTLGDPASARYGESLYAFAARELPGAVRSAIALETRRLKGKPFWGRHNALVTSWIGTALINTLFLLIFGLSLLPFIVLHHLTCWFMLTKANYVEHYGLGRRETGQGKFEPVRPHHSWNSDYWFTNALSFNLQRHSDHHANAARPYQNLETSLDLPQLPAGYPGSFLLALIPPLWFWIMNPRVQAWAHQHQSVINRPNP